MSLLLKGLRDALPEFSGHLTAVALVDRDYANLSAEQGVFQFPVAMIENFLLDPEQYGRQCRALPKVLDFRHQVMSQSR